MTLTDLVLMVKVAGDENPEWRYGQTVFNVLQVYRPEMAESIRGTCLDPFYKREDDTHFWDSFWEWLVTWMTLV